MRVLFLLLSAIINFNQVKLPVAIEPPQNLMIVAHPDDETIWGGAHLLENKYYVVCVTCGVDKRRYNEFVDVMKYTNDEYKTLGFTDLKDGRISNWNKEKVDIEKELKKIIDSRNWNMIVTHNPNGEYGHIQHRKLSSIVTKLVQDKEKLYYFGKYYSKEEVNTKNLVPLNDEVYETKLNEILLKIYTSQKFVSHNHMFKYENFVKYSEW